MPVRARSTTSGNEPIGHWCVAQQQPVIDRAPDDVLGKLDSHAGTKLAALACPVEDRHGPVAARAEQPGVVLDLIRL
jgi:hypothetical protein